MAVFSRISAAAVAGVVALFSIAVAQTPSLPPAEAYTRGSRVTGMSLSPDGSRIVATTMTYSLSGDESALQVIDLGANQIVRAFRAPERVRAGDAFFADDHRVIFSTQPNQRDTGAYVASSIVLLDVDSGRQRVVQARWYGRRYWLPGDPMAVSLIGWEWNPLLGRNYGETAGYDRLGHAKILRIDLDEGGTRDIGDIEHGHNQATWGLLFNDDGDLLARIDADSETNRWQFLVYGPNGLSVELEGVDEVGQPPDLAGILADGRWAIIMRRDNEDHWRMYAFDRGTRQFEAIASNDRYDIGGGIRDRWTNRVVGVTWTEDLPRQRFFDPALQGAYERLQNVFSSGYALVQSWSRDRSRLIVFGETSEDAGTYYLFEPASGALRVLRRAYPDLTGPSAIGDRRSITYRARDGTRIPAYLTLPAGQDRNLPLVVYVHGGPHARDNFTFEPQAAFLASRGYAVLQPNFRGSTGYGYNWFNAGRGNWGDGVMQTDVNDGADALARAGIADPNRTCILGASYGGYAALVGATLTPDRYRCAIAVAAVSDVLDMVDNNNTDWWRLSIGDPRSDRAHLRAVSPANFAEQVRIPILMMHGQEDTTVPIVQSRRMYSRLRGAGKDARLIEFENEFHGFFIEEDRARAFRETEAFLAQHIGQPQ